MLGMYNSDFHNMYSSFNDVKRITDDAIPPLDTNGCSSSIVSDANTTEIFKANEKRIQWATSDAKRDAKIPMTTNITQVVDIVYAKSATEHEKQYHLADIYYPQEMSADSYPVIVSIHGGGWFYGDKELYSRYTKYLAEQGFAVVNFNYRLAPEYKYPCGFSDVCRLMDYISKNAEQYNLDLSRLYMVGDSAGAQLVSQYAIYATNSEYRKLFDELNELDAPIPAKVALNCGVYELSDNDECVVWYLPEKMSEDIRRSTENILEYMNEKFPETFLMASVNDDLCSCSDIMKSKLEELGIPHIYNKYGYSDLSVGHVFHINIISDEAKQCNSDEINFFNKK